MTPDEALASKFLKLLGDEVGAAWRLGARVVLYQESLGCAVSNSTFSIGGCVVGAAQGSQLQLIRIYASVDDAERAEIGVFEAHAARKILMGASLCLGMEIGFA